MHALRVHAFDQPLQLDDLPAPAPGPGQVRERVQACGISFFDLLIARGGYQWRPPLPFTVGSEFAGTVEALGEGVTTLAVGDRVGGSVSIGAWTTQLIAAADVLQRRIAQIWQLISMLGLSPPPATRPQPPTWDEALRAELTGLLEPHRAELRVEPDHAVGLLRALAFAVSHPRMTDQPLTAHEVVAVLLDGIRARDEEA